MSNPASTEGEEVSLPTDWRSGWNLIDEVYPEKEEIAKSLQDHGTKKKRKSKGKETAITQCKSIEKLAHKLSEQDRDAEGGEMWWCVGLWLLVRTGENPPGNPPGPPGWPSGMFP